MIELNTFKLPSGFRGRSKVYVATWDAVSRLLFKTSPKVAYGWRRFLLRLFGAQIGRGVLIRPTVTVAYPWKLRIGDHSWIGDYVTLYSLAEINIGKNSIISQHTYLCTGTHDFKSRSFDILAYPIEIGDGTWVSYGCFVGPGVTIGDNCFIQAASKVTKKVPDNEIIK